AACGRGPWGGSRGAGRGEGRPMTTLTKKTDRQPCQSTRTPPSEGPAAAATAPVAPQRAVAVARRSSGNSGSTRASEAGTSIAPPHARAQRGATSHSTQPDGPPTTAAARNRDQAGE